MIRLVVIIVVVCIEIFAAIGGVIGVVCINEERRKEKERREKLEAQLNKLKSGAATEERLSRLESRIKEGEEKAKIVDERIWSRSKELEEINKKLVDAQNQVVEATSGLAEVVKKKEDTVKEIEELRKACAAIDAELSDAKNTSRAAILREEEDGEGWTFELSGKEKKLINTLQEIKGIYPELEKELAGIEWKKIWLPKVQALCVREKLGCRGIYRLVLKEDKNVCYVGQAVNVKERWYEHIKKMIGADGRGNEKLYEYRPEDFEWSVVEREVGDLNKAERYWIEYYCCVEKGLNSK